MNADERAELQKRLWDLEKANREQADRLAANRGAGGDLASMVAGAADERSIGEPRNQGGRSAPRSRGGPNPVEQANALRDLMAKPEVQALLSSQQKAAIDARYAALFKSLNLAPDQADKLKSLLAERQTTGIDVMEAARAQGIDPRANPAAYRKLMSDARNEVDVGIKSMLGESGFAQLQTYEQTMPQRNLVNELQQRLSYTNNPLNSGQADQLVQILASNSPQRSTANNPAAGGPMSGPPPRGGPDGGGRGPGGDGGWGRGGDLGGLLALGGGGGFMGPGDGGRGGATITTAAVNQSQAVLSQPQVAVLQQLQQQQQAQQQIQQLVRETLASQAKSGAVGTAPTTTGTAQAGGTSGANPSRKRGGGG